MSDVSEKVRQVIATQLRKPIASVQASSKLGADLEADSLEVVEVVMAMEAEFDLELILKEVKVETVQDVVDYIQAAIKARDEQATRADASPLLVGG
jgi:acyl carrier protein